MLNLFQHPTLKFCAGLIVLWDAEINSARRVGYSLKNQVMLNLLQHPTVKFCAGLIVLWDAK